MDITPISSKRIYQSIVEQIVRLIREGKLRPGDRLPPERSLTEMLGVSRASLREALRAMEVIGLVEVRPGEGAFISELNITPFMDAVTPLLLHDGDLESDLLEFRKAIEIDAVRIVIGNGAHGAEKLLPFLDAMRSALECGDTEAGAQADIQFHKTLLHLTDNRMFMLAADCIGCLLASSVRFNREKILRRSGYLSVLLDQHGRIYRAVAGGDMAEAEKSLREHLDLVKSIS